MPVRAVEGKKPYTGGKAIEIDENKVISLRLRDENNLIIWDEGDNEIYVDLQLDDEIRPTDAFPVGVTTGRVIVDNGWDATGTIICAKTTSGDNIKLFYADNGKLYIDNGTGTFKQIYFKGDVDAITNALQTQIDALSGLGRFLSLWDGETGEPISFPLSTPYTYHTGDWYMINVVDNTTNYRPKGSVWVDDDPSETREVETEATEIGDVYIYDGSTWLLQKNGGGGGSAVLFSQLLGSPYDNTNLGSALNSKQNELTAGTGITIQNNVISATSIEYKTQAEYEQITPDPDAHYFIFQGTPVTGVSLDESSITLTTVGETYQLTATVSPNDAYNKSITWSSSDDTIATVDQTGLVECITPGICTITVTTTDGGFTATCGVEDGKWYPGTNTIAYYTLDGNANDETGNYDGTPSNISYTTLASGIDVAVFNGSDSKIAISNSLLNSKTAFTINLWCTLANNTFFGNAVNNQTSDTNGVFIDGIGGTIRAGVGGGSDMNFSASVNTWYNVVLTYDSGVIKGYVNTSLNFNDNHTYASGTNMTIGCRGNNGDRRWNGNLSKVIFEDKAWTLSEIESYYDKTKGDYGIS